MQLLKIEAKAAAHQIQLHRERERHYLANARALKGRHPINKKHRKDEPKPDPVISERALRAEEWAKKNLAEAKAAIDHDYDMYWNLTRFRQDHLRKHARCVHLALTFLKGQPLEHAEQHNYTDPDFDQIEKLVFVFGLQEEGIDPRIVKQHFEEWVQAGTRHPKKPKKTIH